MTGAVEVRPVVGMGEVRQGEDLAALIAGQAELRPGDIVLVSQKIVSKAEGALARPRPGEDPPAARRRLAREQARRVVADRPAVLVTETRHGLVCANGGVDASNAPEGVLVLLPEDPDRSARRIRDGLSRRTGFDVPVIVTDTFGRPWRAGQTDVAIGLSGLAAIRDERGGVDRSGAVLEVTEPAVADELAAAADLVRRKADGVPVVVVRGFDWSADETAGLADLVRPAAADLFRYGSGMLAHRLGQRAHEHADALPPGGAPLTEDDLRLVTEVAAAAGATVTATAGPSSTRLSVDGDRLAGGLVIAALVDLDRAVRWHEADGVLTIEAAVPDPGDPSSR